MVFFIVAICSIYTSQQCIVFDSPWWMRVRCFYSQMIGVDPAALLSARITIATLASAGNIPSRFSQRPPPFLRIWPSGHCFGFVQPERRALHYSPVKSSCKQIASGRSFANLSDPDWNTECPDILYFIYFHPFGVLWTQLHCLPQSSPPIIWTVKFSSTWKLNLHLKRSTGFPLACLSTFSMQWYLG